MEKISSLQNQFIKQLVLLKQKKYRQIEQKFLISGWHLIEAALQYNCVVCIILLDDAKLIAQFAKLKVNPKIKVYVVSQAIINKLTATKTPQPIVAVCQMLEYQSRNDKQLIVLDQIQDPSNLGAILRNMAAFGVDQIILSDDSVDCYNDKVISASQGAIFQTKIVYDNLAIVLPNLRTEGYALYSTFLHQSPVKSLNQINFPDKVVIIFGNEGNGIRREWKSLMTDNFVIKTTNQVESLNLAMSVGIVLYCLFVNNIIEFKH